MDRTADVLIHLPRSKLFSGFPFLLKKLRFLHDIHLLKFMTERKSFLTKKKKKEKKREKATKTNPEQEEKVAVVVGEWERQREKRKRK